MTIVNEINSPAARKEVTLSFVDIVGSTEMKEREPETSWTSTVAWMYEAAEQTVSRSSKGKVVKYLGDGVMLAHDDATYAINDAIAFQERIKDGVDNRYVRFDCSYGIASGKLLSFTDPRGNEDYLGLVADRAFRLGAMAAGRAILVDIETVAYARLNKIASAAGTLLGWTLEDYFGDLQQARLKGFGHPVRFREVRWHRDLFGYRDIERASAAAGAAAVPSRTPPARSSLTSWTTQLGGRGRGSGPPPR